ncbi:MAG: sulfite exporter TauE/SafE family protein, partial [Cyclobacteriaceae bacterium]|nr:sulfite exporter TauE/SafE family protein [Cyclobacteriaceae bacterium]
LFVVGLTSAFGSFSHFKKGNVDVKTALIFGVPSIISVFAVRKFIVPIIPDPVISTGSMVLSKGVFVMVLFAILMLVASVSMIRKPKTNSDSKQVKYNFPLIFVEGLLVGAVTGLVGAGGGFLIIPALVLFAGLPMKQAVGTSLLIIALKSLIGFTGDIGSGMHIDYSFMLIFSTFAIVGIFIGSYLTRFISNEKLKPAFGWFVLVMGVYIFTKELFF